MTSREGGDPYGLDAGAGPGREPVGGGVVEVDDYAGSRVKLSNTAPTPEEHLVHLVREWDIRKDRIARLEAELKAEKARLREVVEGVIPDTLDDAYVEEFRLPDGRKLTDELECIPQVKVEDEPTLWAWMRANGYGDKLKRIISIEFMMQEDEKATKVFDFLSKRLPGQVKDRTFMHDGTAKAFGREVIEKGLALPPEATIFPLRKAKLLPAPRQRTKTEMVQDGS